MAKIDKFKSDMDKISGGMANPVSGMSKEKALEISKKLANGEGCGTWSNMSSEEFMKWWKDSNS